MQIDFLEELLKLCQTHNLHTAVDTCGYSPWENFKRIASLTDLFLFDLKPMNDKTHTEQTGEEIHSFVNGQHTTMGGTHQAAFREAIVATFRNHFKKQFDAADIRSGIVAAVSVRVEDPIFESQTKTKLGSTHMGPGGETIRTFVGNFIGLHFDNQLHRKKEIADAMRSNNIDTSFTNLESLMGHDAFLVDHALFNPLVMAYFDRIWFEDKL